MNIQIIKDSTPKLYQITGGGYAETESKVHVVANMTLEVQQEIVIHEILEVYLPYLSHNKIDELTGLLVNGLSQLQEADSAV